ncbi:MAG: polysaccharide deacetylase family protein [Oscillospiraceae bacterium]|nr:polysaccharide deacetylase family protein [Oscillospiraceae bacterium]
MKAKKALALVCTLAILLALSGCTPSGSSSSSRSSSPAASQSSAKPSSSAASSLPDEDSSISDGLDSSLDESDSPTMRTDFTEIGALSGEALGWGPGGPVDNENRSQGAIAYQEKYGKYDAYFIAPSSENIYLTFDEGYENGYTADILDTLKEKGVHAVFFVTMPYAKEQPELVRRMIDEGHIVGNHSNKHIAYPSLSLEEAKEDLMSLHQYMLDTYQYEMSLFRFPEGNFSEQTLALLQSCGYKTLFWSFAYKDWYVDDQPNPDQALASMLKKAHPGAIYLLHAVSSTNAQVLGDFIDGMREAGFVFSDFK